MPKRRRWLVVIVIVAIGLVVAAVLWNRAAWYETETVSWSQASDSPQTLLVVIQAGVNTNEKVEVNETETLVQITGYCHQRMGSSIALGVYKTISVHLKAPLNGRPVVDRNGKPIPEQSP